MSDSPMSLDDTWTKIVDDLVVLSQSANSGISSLSHQQRAFLGLARLISLTDGIAIVAVPSAMAKEVVEKQLNNALVQVLTQRLGRPYLLAILVNEALTRTEAPEPVSTPTPVIQTETATAPAEHMLPPEVVEQVVEKPILPVQTPNQSANIYPQETPQNWQRTSVNSNLEQTPVTTPVVPTQSQQLPNLNSRYTFDTYVVSTTNQLSYAAARAVAESPAKAYNPLFIWGDSGLGKTHLLHAIGNYAQVLSPNLRIKYVSSEEFTNDYINSVRDDRQESFKRRYRDLDILMVDDIQFLQGKEGTQEEFFHTFNALQQNGKQIVLSSDRPPKQLTTLEDRLRTRFQSGLIADVYPPDLETRIAILRNKAEAENLHAENGVLELIATRFNTSIRELEGAFIRVSAFASLSQSAITMEVAEQALRDMMPDQTEIEVNSDVIMEVTAKYFNITKKDLLGKSKAQPVVHTRHIAMYLCRELTDLSLPRIGKTFGGKDHSTVSHAIKRIRDELNKKQDTYDEIQQITQLIKNHTPG